MKALPLPSIEAFKKRFNYDPITGVFTHKVGRQGCVKGALAGHVEKGGRLRLWMDNRRYLASRIAYLWVHGWCPEVVDHKDRDVTNDAIDNLRPATNTQNTWNSAGHSDKKTHLPKGIRLSKNGKRFRVHIQIDGNRFSVGTYDSLSEATSARDAVAIKHHGEFFAKEHVK